jgi:hypothetical protein
MMYGHEKSDLAIVAGKPANKAEQSAAQLVEPRVTDPPDHDTPFRVGCGVVSVLLGPGGRT